MNGFYLSVIKWALCQALGTKRGNDLYPKVAFLINAASTLPTS